MKSKREKKVVSKTNQFSSVEEKVEAIIKTVKREFPDLTSAEHANIVTGITRVTFV